MTVNPTNITTQKRDMPLEVGIIRSIPIIPNNGPGSTGANDPITPKIRHKKATIRSIIS